MSENEDDHDDIIQIQSQNHALIGHETHSNNSYKYDSIATHQHIQQLIEMENELEMEYKKQMAAIHKTHENNAKILENNEKELQIILIDKYMEDIQQIKGSKQPKHQYRESKHNNSTI